MSVNLKSSLKLPLNWPVPSGRLPKTRMCCHSVARIQLSKLATSSVFWSSSVLFLIFFYHFPDMLCLKKIACWYAQLVYHSGFIIGIVREIYLLRPSLKGGLFMSAEQNKPEVEAQNLSDATSPIDKIQWISKTTVTFKSLMRLWYLLRFILP